MHNGKPAQRVLDLTVKNHPGVMSHVAGLFARRAFNVECILCLPVPDTETSRIWLGVPEDGRIEQLVKQLEKLQDVLEVRPHSADQNLFECLEKLIGNPA